MHLGKFLTKNFFAQKRCRKIKTLPKDFIKFSIKRKQKAFLYAKKVTSYIAKIIIQRLQCNLKKSFLTGQCTTASYFHLLSRGNLTLPSNAMAELTCSAFTLLDYYDHLAFNEKIGCRRCSFVH